MREIKCRVLYRVPINIDLLDELIEIGKLFEKRKQILTVIKNISDVSCKLRLQWMKEYSYESSSKTHSNDMLGGREWQYKSDKI
jgi:hypothetical protein